MLKYREKEVKKIEIGGRWELVDQLGNTRNSDELKGKWSIIYFGFTHCPDICPEEMDKMTAVAEGLGMLPHNFQYKVCQGAETIQCIRFITEKANVPVQPIFITVDPERDSADVVKKYLHEFSDKILGLTGTVEQIEKVCKLFRVYFKVGPKDTDNDYIVSAFTSKPYLNNGSLSLHFACHIFPLSHGNSLAGLFTPSASLRVMEYVTYSIGQPEKCHDP